MVSRYDHEITQSEWALGFQFDIVLRGHNASVFEEEEDEDE
jgi:protocatechuate 3,4-dioxygenase beta subunit